MTGGDGQRGGRKIELSSKDVEHRLIGLPLFGAALTASEMVTATG